MAATLPGPGASSAVSANEDVRGAARLRGNRAASGGRRVFPTRVPRVALMAAAGATAVALAYAFAPSEDEVVVTPRGPARSVVTEAPRSDTTPSLSTAARPDIPLAGSGDPFTAASFVPPPPPAPVVVPPPPPPPKAPPLPFTFVGLLESGAEKPAAFLAHGDALLVVSAGEVVENDYRIESLSPTEVVLMYLPLKERQKLNVTGAKQ